MIAAGKAFPKAGLVVQPRDGAAPVRALFDAARSSILVKMFTFTSPELLEALAAARQRGVTVRVMLNPSRSSGSRANDESFAQLKAAGIDIAWTSPHFAVTHEKSLVVDAEIALISTFNYCTKYFTSTRDYGLITRDPGVVREIASGFEADWQRQPLATESESPLLWSNHNARGRMVRFIDAATDSLRVQHPKYSDLAILDRLLDAHDRGVHIRIICGGQHGISPSDMLDTFSSLRILKRAGIRIRKQHQLRLHAKLLVADGEHALLGSMNIDRSAFDLRRELGIVLHRDPAVDALRRWFDRDWEEAAAYHPPDPMELDLHTEIDQQPIPELDHE